MSGEEVHEFYPVPRWALRLTSRSLRPEQRISPMGAHLLGVIGFFERGAAGEAFPSMRTIADELGVDVRTVRLLIHELEDRGVLEVARGRGRGHLTVYRTLPPRLGKEERPIPFPGVKEEQTIPFSDPGKEEPRIPLPAGKEDQLGAKRGSAADRTPLLQGRDPEEEIQIAAAARARESRGEDVGEDQASEAAEGTEPRADGDRPALPADVPDASMAARAPAPAWLTGDPWQPELTPPVALDEAPQRLRRLLDAAWRNTHAGEPLVPQDAKLREAARWVWELPEVAGDGARWLPIAVQLVTRWHDEGLEAVEWPCSHFLSRLPRLRNGGREAQSSCRKRKSDRLDPIQEPTGFPTGPLLSPTDPKRVEALLWAGWVKRREGGRFAGDERGARRGLEHATAWVLLVPDEVEARVERLLEGIYHPNRDNKFIDAGRPWSWVGKDPEAFAREPISVRPGRYGDRRDRRSDGYIALQAKPGEFGTAEDYGDADIPQDPAMRARAILLAEYRKRYKSGTSVEWPGDEHAKSNAAGLDTAVRFALAKGVDVIDPLLDGFFRDDWARSQLWPLAALATNPHRFLLAGPARSRSGRGRADGCMKLQAEVPEDIDIPDVDPTPEALGYGPGRKDDAA